MDVIYTRSKLGAFYDIIYSFISGKHPNVRIWHFQWAATYYLNNAMKKLLSELEGNILDIGCGNKPYKEWFRCIDEYIGVDIYPSPEADMVIDEQNEWPLDDHKFDVVLCTQVIEHAKNYDLIISEANRVLKKGGKAIFTFPFLYNVHGAPYDYRRFTEYGTKEIFSKMNIIKLDNQGGIGTTIAILILNWIEQILNQNTFLRIMKALLLPLLLVISLLLNVFGYLLDRIDTTKCYYSNILVVIENR